MWRSDEQRGGDWLFSVALAIASLVPRLYVALSWAREPVWDGQYYDFGARRIAEGFGYADELVIHGVRVWHPWCHYPVGYSGLLAGAYRLFGTSQHVPVVMGAVVGALTVLLTHRVAREWLSSGRARIAAVIVAVHVEAILYSALVMTELVAGFGVLAAVWIGLALRSRSRTARTSHSDSKVDAGVGPRWRDWTPSVASGVVTGLTTLVHPQTVLLAPALGWFVTSAKRAGTRRRLAEAAVVLATTLAVVAPWTIRNCRVMDGCAFVSSNGGWNLAIGAVPKATGRFVTLRSSDGCRVVTGQVQQDRCWSKLAWEYIRSDPVRWLKLAPRKLSYCFDHASFAVEYLRQAEPRLWPEQRRVSWRLWLLRWHGLLLSLAAFAFVGRAPRDAREMLIEAGVRGTMTGLVVWAWTAPSPTFWPLAVGIVVVGLWPRQSAPESSGVDRFALVYWLVFLVLHVVFFGEDRYHVPLIPWIAMFAAAVGRKSRGACENRVASMPSAVTQQAS